MSEEKVIDLISEIIKIREKYKHLAEVSYTIWKQRFENDKNNKSNQSVNEGETLETKEDILNELLEELSFYMIEYESKEEIKNKIELYRQRWENTT